jgi:hypothetical protein
MGPVTPELIDRVCAAIDPSDGGAEEIERWLREYLTAALEAQAQWPTRAPAEEPWQTAQRLGYM